MTLTELITAGLGFLSSLLTYLIGHTHGKTAGAAQAAQTIVKTVEEVAAPKA